MQGAPFACNISWTTELLNPKPSHYHIFVVCLDHEFVPWVELSIESKSVFGWDIELLEPEKTSCTYHLYSSTWHKLIEIIADIIEAFKIIFKPLESTPRGGPSDPKIEWGAMVTEMYTVATIRLLRVSIHWSFSSHYPVDF